MADVVIVLVIIGVIFFWLIQSGRISVSTNRDYIDPDVLRAARGNKGLARRMMNQVRTKYPGKSESWYIEKVIYDLGRDHGVINSRRSSFSSSSFDHREVRENIFIVRAFLSLFNYFVSTVKRILRR